MRDDYMLDFLNLAALVGISFGVGYGVRDLISRRRRHRRRLHVWPGDWSSRPNSGPVDSKPDKQPTEPARDIAINLDHDSAGRRRRNGGQTVQQRDQRDDLDIALRDLLGELSRR